MHGISRYFIAFAAGTALWARMGHSGGLDKGVADVIFKHCQGCHTKGGHASGLVMNTLESLMKGGERGPVVVPGEAAKSRLFLAIDYHAAALKMPPRGRIPQEDINVVARWINGLNQSVTSSATVKPARAEKPAPVGRPMLPEPMRAEPMRAEPMRAMTQTAMPVAAKTASDMDGATPEQEKFFETKVRPVLVTKCYTCHTQAANGGLRLDSHAALLKGGSHGPVVIAGKPEESKLLAAVRYDGALKMPPGGQLEPSDINTLREWIADGAAWPAPRAAKPRRRSRG